MTWLLRIALSWLLLALPAYAQSGSAKTTAALNTEVGTLFPDNSIGAITPFNGRQMLLDIIASAGVLQTSNTWTKLQTFDAGFGGAGPVGMINTTTPVSFSTPGYAFNDLGILGFSFADTSTHFALTITGASPTTGTGSYTGLIVTEYGQGRSAAAFITGGIFSSNAIGGNGNFTGGNPQVIICGTALIVGICPNGTAATVQSAVGTEVDIFSFAGATMLYKQGVRVADLGVIQASGAGNLSAGVVLVRDTTAPGFVNGIYFGDPTNIDINFPITTTGTLLSMAPTTRALNSAIDLSPMAGTFTNGAIILPLVGNAMYFGPTGAGGKWSSLSFSGQPAVNLQFGSTNAIFLQAAATLFSGTLSSGNPGTNSGALSLLGLTSGTATLSVSATGAHTTFTGGVAPTLTAGCNGAGSSVSGNDITGTVTGQTAAATTCTLTFGTAFGAAPNCVAMGQNSPLTGAATPLTGTLVVNFASTANYKFSYFCQGA